MRYIDSPGWTTLHLPSRLDVLGSSDLQRTAKMRRDKLSGPNHRPMLPSSLAPTGPFRLLRPISGRHWAVAGLEPDFSTQRRLRIPIYIFLKIFIYTFSVLRFTRNINWMDQMECILIGWTRWNALAHGRTLSIHLGRGVYCWTICTFASQISNLIFSLVIHPNLIPFELRCCLEFS